MGNSTSTTLAGLDDRFALQNLTNTCHWHAEYFDRRALADWFTHAAAFDFSSQFGTKHGREHIHDICKGYMDHVYDAMQHVMVNPEIDLTGTDIAKAKIEFVWTRGGTLGEVFQTRALDAAAG